MKSILLGLLVLTMAACSHKPTVKELKAFAAIESYPFDTYLDTVSNKKALIIVAHDDDDCAMSGTIAGLTQKGWTIKQLSLVSHINPETSTNSAHIICDGNELILDDGLYRLGLDTSTSPYVPIPHEAFDRLFLREKVAAALVEKINAFNPSVLFTLDNEKGGYGHPDHVFISQLVVDLLSENKINAQRIYQSVYTDHMEEVIVDTWLKAKMEEWGYPHASTIANEMYGIDGMPEPDVQVDIFPYAETKMNYLRDYPESAKRNLRKFIPYYEEFDAKTYFAIFNREFFRVVGSESFSLSPVRKAQVHTN
ncbi:PIG-L family deacetylase [Cryomorphaceae bacterium 1068]|nr:PIG-L family deacetylase [Cryomorphaceae bacterium 1068]